MDFVSSSVVDEDNEVVEIISGDILDERVEPMTVLLAISLKVGVVETSADDDFVISPDCKTVGDVRRSGARVDDGLNGFVVKIGSSDALLKDEGVYGRSVV